MNYNYKFITIIIGLSINILYPQIAKAICSNKQVDEMAEKITVLIDSKAPGSGVIIKREGDIYTVLTAYHVVKNSQLKYEVVTPDSQRYPLNYQTVKLLDQNIDLAVLQFNSSRNYQVAKFGNSQQLQRRTKVYVAGFPVRTGSVNLSVYDCRDGKLIIRNISRGMSPDNFPFTERDYSNGRSAESTDITFGTEHRGRVFVVRDDDNEFEYEIRENNSVVERGEFSAVVSRSSTISEVYREAREVDKGYCAEKGRGLFSPCKRWVSNMVRECPKD